MSTNEPPPPPPPPPPYPGAAVPGGIPGPPPQNKKAVWALILGILGFLCCGVFAAVPALILGSQAKREIAASAGRQTGAGMAQAGFVLGIIGTILGVLGLILLVGLIATGNFSTTEPMIGPPANY
ncbi:MAG TPA: DUF4190 domain-containing protein [Aeromicrobium sp.]|nr:DUF4190 domain-containing protein [Aeromicrobium sp.]